MRTIRYQEIADELRGRIRTAGAQSLLPSEADLSAEFDVSRDPDLRMAMTKRACGSRTVPQIFIGSTHVGGCDDLVALDSRGGLLPLLNA